MTWLDIVRFIGRIIWTAVRMCLILFFAIVLGGLRGASKTRMHSRSPND